MRRHAAFPPLWPLVLALPVTLTACDSVEKVRMRVLGLHVCAPPEESPQWVLARALAAANDPDEERGWADFQQLLHTSERSPAALRGWREGNWARMRRQSGLYLDAEKCFDLVDFREMQGDVGDEYYVANHARDLPTPCAVYLDPDNHNQWRIKRCSL